MNSERQGGFSRFRLERFRLNETHLRYIKNLFPIIKILVGLALLILSLQGIRLDNLVSGIRSANITWLSLAILSILLGLFLKLWRWATFIKNYHIQVSNARLFSAYFVGQAVNIVLPLRGGELVRLGYFAGEPKVLPQAASTIVLEKYLDLLALTICTILVSLRISFDNVLNLRGVLLPVIVAMTLFLLAAIFLGPAVWERVKERKLLPKSAVDWLDRWVQVSQWLKNPKQVFPGILLTGLIWGIMWATNLLLFKSLGLALGGTAAGLILILVYIGLFPALMPGNIGPFYFFARLALLPFGIIHEPAMVFAVILHAIATLLPLLGGAIGLFIRSNQPIST